MDEDLKKRLLSTLIDARFMINEELHYVRTGKHRGQPMRDCRGQWDSLVKDIEARLLELKPN